MSNNKIRCVCPCCGQIGYVNLQTFAEMQKLALGLGTTVEVLPDEEEELEEI